MGLATKITNVHDRKPYWVSTTKNPLGIWETAVFERGFLGMPKKGICGVCPLTPSQVAGMDPRDIASPEVRMGKRIVFIPVTAIADEDVREIHAMVAELAADQPQERWQAMFAKASNEYLGNRGLLSEAVLSEPPSDADLRDLAWRGQVADAILLAFARDAHQPLDATEFEAHLSSQFQQQGTRALMREGYRLRLAEERLSRGGALLALGPVDAILRTDKPAGEKTKEIVEYLEAHDVVGLGDPIRPYVVAPFDEVHKAFDQFVTRAVEVNRIPEPEREMQAEVFHRYLAYGYAYRVAEELVRQSLSASTLTSPRDGNVESPQDAVANFVKERPDEDRVSWEPFHGKPNTPEVLREKARVVATLIDRKLNAGLVLASGMKDKDPNIRLGERDALRVYLETAALLLRVLDELAFRYLSSDNRDVFMDALEGDVAQCLVNRGVDSIADDQVLEERIAEYASYRAWTPEKDEGAKGTLFWEFANRVADALGIGKDPIFNVGLTWLLVKSMGRWHLAELLSGSPQ